MTILRHPALEQTQRTSVWDVVCSYPVRLAVYGLLTVVTYQILFRQLKTHGPAAMGNESGPLENGQIACAIFAATCLFYASLRCSLGRAGLVVCGALVAYAAARESDTLFESVFFDDAYKYLAGIPLGILGVVTLIIHRRTFISESIWLMKQPAATIFVIASVYLCGVCQIYDRPDMWSVVADQQQASVTKAMIEEFSELFAYMLLAFSGVEAVVLSVAKVETESIVQNDAERSERTQFKPRIAA